MRIGWMIVYLVMVGVIQPMYSQKNFVRLKGQVLDAELKIPLKDVGINIREDKPISANNQGEFDIRLTMGDVYHISFHHKDCESVDICISISKDTNIFITLAHYHKHIQEVKIMGTTAVSLATVSGKMIQENANENLSNLLELEAGVSSQKTGTSISKPVIQGMSGNRMTILQQGVAQSGQQWGSDHAPEIDPLAANKIRVVQGVGTLEYKAIQQGAIVYIEPSKIAKAPHIHGKFHVFAESNGRGFGTRIELEKNAKLVAWKGGFTWKKFGDRNTPEYFLRNTGSQELSGDIQLDKKWKHQWQSNFYFSTYYTELGILKGAHVSNLTDLASAMQRKEPFFTQPEFDASIDAPKQKVNHHFGRISVKKDWDSGRKSIAFNFASQLNDRKEYDVRRGGRSELPILSLVQYSNFFEMKYQRIKEDEKLKFGTQLNYVENINQPETGVSPLIPNYSSIEPSVYFIKSYIHSKQTMDIGIRYDGFYQNIYRLTSNTSLVEHSEKTFHNLALSAGYDYNWTSHTNLKISSVFAWRNPAINELYSFGLHQGVSGIEIGNTTLIAEKSWKTTASFISHIKETVFFDIQPYFHNINDYIFLMPSNEMRLTIRGAYPVFNYAQTHAQIVGCDASVGFNQDVFHAKLSYHYLRGWDLTQNQPLVNMPSNRIECKVGATLEKWGIIKTPSLAIMGRYVFKQTNLNENQDYMLPPNNYCLIGLTASGKISIKNMTSNIYFKINNLLDISYRDYMNRWRYFADDMGRSFVVGLNTNF